jgi:hypothetical protein
MTEMCLEAKMSSKVIQCDDGVLYLIYHTCECDRLSVEKDDPIKQEDDFHVPVVLEGHDLINLGKLASSYDLIEDMLVLLLHVGSVDVLHGNNWGLV